MITADKSFQRRILISTLITALAVMVCAFGAGFTAGRAYEHNVNPKPDTVVQVKGGHAEVFIDSKSKAKR
jgi:hypothetical protein